VYRLGVGALLLVVVPAVFGALIPGGSVGHRAIWAGALAVAGIVAVFVLVFGCSLLLAPIEQRNALREERADLAARAGTFIPPGWNAIVTWTAVPEGEWVPPGYKVTMDQGPVHDDLGNTASSVDARVYGGQGNSATGPGSQCGAPPWLRQRPGPPRRRDRPDRS
jgi:hypothetical protein